MRRERSVDVCLICMVYMYCVENFSSCNAAPTEYARHAPPRRDHGGGQRGIFMALRWRHAIRADHFTLPREYLCMQQRAHTSRPPAPPARLHAQHDSTRAAEAHARARTSSCPWQRPPRAQNARIRKARHRPGKPATAPRHICTPGQHGTHTNLTRNPSQLDDTNPTNLTNSLQSLPSAASPCTASGCQCLRLVGPRLVR